MLGDLDFEVEDAVEAATQLVHEDVERLRLRDGARESIDDEAFGGVWLAEAVANHADHDVVGDVMAPGQDGLGLEAQWRAGLDLRPQHVAGRDMRDPETIAKHVRLRTLPAPRSAIQKQIHGTSG